ncbi:FliG C-terminal domain-containing protein [Anaeromyxobacter oryzisoli]|uniref:FliG C-terminal domain-containing protein n=1 Tax=Anaeromyxobacter oryzisoli TaxID=2925408 RepID=UPI001F5921D8|nr:FliG C-terminal domain-containing protein [Anaeromyxobacter sp. SG63]
MIAARIELQRQLGDWLTKSLAGPAEPFRIEVSVRLDLRGQIHEIREKQQSVAPDVKIGGKNRVKLPGFGTVDGGGQGTVVPEINIGGGGRVVEQVTRQLETEVNQMTVLLFVDPAMPKQRRELLTRLASDLAGVDKSRGDEVVVEERPTLPGQASGTVLSATIQAAPRLTSEVVAICLTAIVAAVILAFGLSRRSAAERAAGAQAARASGGEAATPAAAAAQAERAELRKRREDLGAFGVLADATARELVQVVAEADAATATAIVDLFGLDGEASKLMEELVPAQRRLEIGVTLATSRVLTREQVAQMEAAAGAVLRRIRDRVPLGGPARVAEFLSQVPDAVRREVLDGIAVRDQGVADAARSAMMLFEDLARLADASVRQVVTGIDPSVVALALVGAPEARAAVHGAVSKRLRAILEAEEEVVQQKGPAEIEAARRVLEDAMRQLNVRGELHVRQARAA